MIKVLAPCDGLSTGLAAFLELGVDVEYHSIEINPKSRNLSDANFDGIKRWEHDLTKVTEKQIKDNGPFDWIILGPTCKSVSVASCGPGLLGSSGILIDGLRAMHWCQKYNPDVKYLIENVKMKKLFLQQFNSLIGHEPVLIDSNLVSAQNRQRYYWAPFEISQPKDRGIELKDVLDSPYGGYGWSKSTRYKDKKTGRVYSSPAPDRDRYVEERINDGKKSNTLMTGKGCRGQSTETRVLINKKGDYRPLSVREAARLQTLPEDFDFSAVSETHAYRALGDGWTLEVIKHILKEGGACV